MAELPLATTNKVDRKALAPDRPRALVGVGAAERLRQSHRTTAMKAAVIYEHGGPGSIRYDAEFPDPKPAAGEVLVRVKAATLNYHDIFTRRGMPGIKVPMPCIMGIDFAGEIAALGAGVSDWTVGDRVMIDPVDRVGGGGLIGEVRPGGLAEYCAVPTHHLVKLPASVSYEAAACLPVAYGTALRMMVTIGQVKAGEKVLILGASGGVGTCCVQLAKLAGAEVIVCASSAEKLARLKELGADHGIDYTKEDFVKWVYAKYGKPHRRRFDGGCRRGRQLHRRRHLGALAQGAASAGSHPHLRRHRRLRSQGGPALHLDLRAQHPRLQWLDARGPDARCSTSSARASSSPSSIASCRCPRPTRPFACSRIASCSAR